MVIDNGLLHSSAMMRHARRSPSQVNTPRTAFFLSGRNGIMRLLRCSTAGVFLSCVVLDELASVDLLLVAFCCGGDIGLPKIRALTTARWSRVKRC
jgi:hypothetical protein